MTEKSTATGSGHELQHIDFTTLFASNIHDIKNLLFLLLSTLDETIDQYGHVKDPQVIPAKLSLLKYNGQRINDKLIQLLSLYRMAQGSYEVDIEYHSVAEFIEDMTLETWPLLNARSILINSSVTDGLCWFFDRDIASGIIANAIHNALSRATSKIMLSASVVDDFLVIRVEDDGDGFPESILENTANPKNTGIAEGRTGLGLYFSSITAALHANKGKTGHIELSNGGSLGGAVFALYLP